MLTCEISTVHGIVEYQTATGLSIAINLHSHAAQYLNHYRDLDKDIGQNS